MADDAPLDRPPQFLFGEVVRINQACGGEHTGLDEPVEPRRLLGQEAVVQGAFPTDAQDGWTVSAWIASLGDIVFGLCESGMETTGLVELVKDGDAERVPRDTRPEWRDDVLIDATIDAPTRGQAENCVVQAVERLRALPAASDVAWRLSEYDETTSQASIWVWSQDDALAVWREIVATVDSGWDHDDDERLFVQSRWTRGEGGSPFLVPCIDDATVIYRRWTSPRRRSRGDG